MINLISRILNNIYKKKLESKKEDKTIKKNYHNNNYDIKTMRSKNNPDIHYLNE